MIVHVVEARYLEGHRVWLRFDDGLQGEVDLSADLEGTMFAPLQEPSYFAGFSVDTTLTWPNGADFAPEYLHEQVRSSRSSLG